MKLKLFFLSILVLISFVAYQKYSEYSSLKSIDSYDSCITSKGSIIQETYPATCVTRLGARFAQQVSQINIPGEIIEPTIKGWTPYLSKKVSGFTLDYPPGWHITEEYRGNDNPEGTFNRVVGFYKQIQDNIPVFSMRVFNRVEKSDSEAKIKRHINDSLVVSKASIHGNEVSIIRRTFQNEGPQINKSNPFNASFSAFFWCDNHMYDIEYLGFSDRYSNFDIYRKILTSFQCNSEDSKNEIPDLKQLLSKYTP